MIALKFWTWLRDYANEKVKQSHMRIYGHARKCQNCNTWTSEVGGCASITDCSLYFKGALLCKRIEEGMHPLLAVALYKDGK